MRKSAQPRTIVDPAEGATEQDPFTEVIERAAEGDPEAWGRIYERFSGPLFGFFLHQARDREVAEDLTAGVFLEALQSRTRFYGDAAALRSWLFRIARNNLIDHWRRSQRTRSESFHDIEEGELSRVVATEDPEDTAIVSLDRQRLRAGIETLSADQQEVVLLRLAGDLTSAEIAAIVGKSVGAVKALQHRAIAALARVLGDKVSRI
ncbi:MAG: RNA polymerase sigma factor [Actinomycetota bacterium]